MYNDRFRRKSICRPMVRKGRALRPLASVHERPANNKMKNRFNVVNTGARNSFTRNAVAYDLYSFDYTTTKRNENK